MKIITKINLVTLQNLIQSQLIFLVSSVSNKSSNSGTIVVYSTILKCSLKCKQRQKKVLKLYPET